MNDLWLSAALQILGPVLIALAGWLATRLPGPLRTWLAAGTHQRDIELLLGAMARKAQSSVITGPTSPGDVVAYVKTVLPEVVTKLDPSYAALETMAQAALVTASKQVAR